MDVNYMEYQSERIWPSGVEEDALEVEKHLKTPEMVEISKDWRVDPTREVCYDQAGVIHIVHGWIQQNQPKRVSALINYSVAGPNDLF
jgi:hypothetical protein